MRKLHDDWQEALTDGRQWTINYRSDAPESEWGGIQRVGDDLFTVMDGDQTHAIENLPADQVPEALKELGIANKGWL